MEAAVWVALIAAAASIVVAAINYFGGRSDRREIKGSVKANTELIGQTQADARLAYSEANALNRKIVELGVRLDNSIVVNAREAGEMRNQLMHIAEEIGKLAGAATQEKALLEGKLHILRNQVNVLQNRDKALEIAAARREQLERREAAVIHTDKLEADELTIKHKDIKG